jgi:translation elongation factor EF-Tu-like GTPase
MPGENLLVKVEFMKKAVINEGLRFIMREGKLTIGTGIVIEILD